MFVACGIWCLADVSSVSPSSEQLEKSDFLLLEISISPFVIRCFTPTVS